MPRSSGTFTLVAGNPVVSGTVISSTVQNNTLNDIGNEITNSIPRDGSAPPTANVPLGNFKITGLGAASLVTDVPQFQQVQNGSAIYLTSVTGTNAITASLITPSLATYAAGNVFNFTATGTNTGATTININALGIKTINKDGAAVSANDITSGRTYELIYDGTNFNLLGGASISSTSIQVQAFTAFTTGGTSAAYTLTPVPALTALTTNARFNITLNSAPTGSPTIAVSGLAARSLKYYDATGVKQFITAAQTPLSWNTDVINDGTDFVVQTVLAPTILPAASVTDVNARTSTVRTVTPASLTGLIVSGTAVATTAGTSVDITGIPVWVKRITVMFNGVSTNGASLVQIQLGSGSVDSTSYIGGSVQANGTTLTSINFSSGFACNFGAATNTRYGAYVLNLISSNLWQCSLIIGLSDIAGCAMGGGTKTLSGTLDRIRLTTINGTDTFDAGSVNILYE